MYSAALSQIGSSSAGDFRLELSRVQRPLNGMKWISSKLVADGIIDPERIGLAGLSYGAEIGMYSYWNWNSLRAVSMAGGSWSPSSYLFGGPIYSRFMDQRGFPGFDENGMRKWRALSAGLNATASLPPLLFQTPDGEE